MTLTITISNQTGEEVSRILSGLQFRVRKWPGVNPFRIGLYDHNGKLVGDCVANSTPERSECVRCGDPLEGGAKTLCLQCQEESTPEIANIYEREFEEEHD